MSGGHSLAIPLGFLMLTGALGWYLAYAKGRWVIKAFLTAFLAFYSLEVWSSLDSYAGWPSKEELPQRSLLISVIVHEPNPGTRDSGAIFLWVVPLGQDDLSPFSYRPVSGEPRGYRIPYSRAMHEQAAAAMKSMQQGGRPILIERGSGQGDGDGSGSGNQSTYDDDSGGGFHMRELPPPSLPQKAPQ